MKKAFTMIELIFVIVILGILATMSTDMILNIYRNYVYSKAINELESKVENAIEQISARLNDRIRFTTISRRSNPNNLVAANADFTDVAYTRVTDGVLEWYGQSTESRFFMNGANYGWSGFLYQYGACGYNAGTRQYTSCFAPNGNFITQIQTPKTTFQNAATVIGGLGSTNAAIVFSGNTKPENYYGVGAPNNSATDINLVTSAGTQLNLTGNGYQALNGVGIENPNHLVSERYYITHSAYAIVPGVAANYNDNRGRAFSEYDLHLFYNYYPWLNQNYTNGSNQILLRHVTLFRFRGNDGAVEFKLCARDPNNLPNNQDFIVCKSKVVL